MDVQSDPVTTLSGPFARQDQSHFLPYRAACGFAGEVRAPISSIVALPMNERKVIAHRTMLMIDRPHAIVNLGIGMPEVCYLLLLLQLCSTH